MIWVNLSKRTLILLIFIHPIHKQYPHNWFYSHFKLPTCLYYHLPLTYLNSYKVVLEFRLPMLSKQFWMKKHANHFQKNQILSNKLSYHAIYLQCIANDNWKVEKSLWKWYYDHGSSTFIYNVIYLMIRIY